MRQPVSRHYTEEELLMHFLQEETPNTAGEISSHLLECGECDAIFKDYADVVGRIQAWSIPDLADDVWRAQKAAVLAQFRQEQVIGKNKGLVSALLKNLQSTWSYALEHPLPTLGYVAIAITFAMEQTISTFRLDRILPGASEVFEILKQIL
jgi:hypothetical protein